MLIESQLRSTLEQFLAERPACPGLVVAAMAGDHTYLGGAAGVADKQTRRALQADATFRIASVTKTYAAAVALRLAEQQVIDLDDPITRYLGPDIVNMLVVIDGVSYGHEITIRQLLLHTAGIPSVGDDDYIPYLLRNPDKVWTPRTKLDFFLAGVEAAHRPGARAESEYCDHGYVTLALLLEAVTGQQLHELYRSQLHFERLGLRATYVEKLEPIPPASGERVRHYWDGVDVSHFDATCDLWGGGGIVADAGDLCRFWHALFRGKVYDSPKTLQQMCEVVPTADPHRYFGDRYGLGIMWDGRYWCHTGSWGAFALYDTKTDTSIAGFFTEHRAGIPGDPLRDLLAAFTDGGDVEFDTHKVRT
jgi:D-alanyl-D-alanine carboxypeptidase